MGYILSTPSTRDFAADWRDKYIPSLDATLLPPPKSTAGAGTATGTEASFESLPAELLERLYGDVETLFNFSHPGLVDKWPAHLHIDILPEWQGQGWGRKLMTTLLKVLAERGCRGVHLGMEAGNTGALKFYKSLGFERFPVALDGGASGETGRTREGVLYLVKNIDDGGGEVS